MNQTIAPTKNNLLAEKKRLHLANIGFDLMDRKRQVLIREMVTLIEQVKQLQKEISSTFHNAYDALQKANITTGIRNDLIENVPIDESLSVRSRSVMGVELPLVKCDLSVSYTVPYGLSDSNSALDDAYFSFIKVKHLCARMSQVENSVYRLAEAIMTTQKRTNALKNVIIPESTVRIKQITMALEEKEREEFSRMKLIKKSKHIAE